MIFYNAKVKAVKADLAKGEITVTLTMSINDEHMQEASILAATYTGEDASDVEVHIMPRQLSLFDSVLDAKMHIQGNLDSSMPGPTEADAAEQSTGEEESQMESEEEGVIEIDYETDTQTESEEEETDEPIP